MATELTLIDFEGSSFPTAAVPVNSVKFEEAFWGQECRGFEVLHNNLKATASAAQHFGEYIKERVSIEKSYVKGLQKLAKSYNQVADPAIGSFYPVWLVVLKTLDTACSNKEKHIEHLKELGKEIDDYAHKRDEKMKSYMRGDIEIAQKALNAFLHTVVGVRKKKKQYKSCCTDVVVQQRELEKIKQDPASKAKDVEKYETKVKKSLSHMESSKGDYQRAIQKHHDQWKEFEQKMTTASKKFQQLEEEHLAQMRLFVIRLADVHENHHVTLYRDFKKLKEKMDTLPVEKILSMFTQIKGTGKKKPDLLQFAEIAVDALQLSHSASQGSISSEAKKNKRSKGKKVKNPERPPSTNSTASATVANATEENSPEVDAEGFTIRPKDAEKITHWDNDLDRDSSDFDSDDEPEKKIRDIKIKDIAADVTSIDELSSVAKTLKLEAPQNGVRRSGSTQSLNSQSENSSKLQKPSPYGSQSLLSELGVSTSSPNVEFPPITLSISQPTTSNSSQPLPNDTASSIVFPVTWENVPLDASLPPLPPPSLQTSSVTSSWTTFTPEISRSASKSIDKTLGSANKIPDPSNPTNTTDLITQTQELINKTQISLKGSTQSGTIQESPAQSTNALKPKPQSPKLQEPNTSQDLSVSSLDRGVRPLIAPPSPLIAPPSPATPTERKRGVLGSPNTSLGGSGSQPGSPMGKRPPGSNTLLSPLATRAVSVVPIAVAFQETCNAIFKGSDLSKAIVKVTGTLDFSFPSSYISALSEPLSFTINKAPLISQVLHNQNFLTLEREDTFVFQMEKLKEYLEQSRRKQSAPFYNIPALKYEVAVEDASKLPLMLTCFWKGGSKGSVMRLDYTYNPLVFPLSPAPPLQQASICLPIKGHVTETSSDPTGTWVPDKQQMIWNLDDIDPSEEPGTRTIQCKFNIVPGDSGVPAPVIVKFLCDGSTLSGASLTVNTSSYKISLKKNKCASGTYMIENLAGVSPQM